MKKKRILYHSDSPLSKTGFGTVSNHILKALVATGKYEIDVIGINHQVPWYDQKQYPYKIYPASFGGDDLGLGLARDLLKTGGFDIYFAVNDPDVHLLLSDVIKTYQPQIGYKTLMYMPIDTDIPLPVHKQAIELADYPVLYTRESKDNLKRKFGTSINKATYINHGCDTDTFKPVSDKVRKAFRKQSFDCDDDTFLVVCVNRNQWRKDFARLMLGFLLFWKSHPKAKLYFHANPKDRGGDLLQQLFGICYLLELAPEDILGKVVLLGNDKTTTVSKKTLNMVYNSADLFVSTTQGEGWGLTTTEAMSAGVPVLISDNTTASTIVGKEERGYLIPCGTDYNLFVMPYGESELIRPIVDVNKLSEKLEYIYTHRQEAKKKAEKALEWCRGLNWEVQAQKFINIIEEIKWN